MEDNPFFAQVARAVEQQALSRGYSISISYSIFDINNRDLISLVESSKTDGAIVLGRFHEEAMKFLEMHYKNLVYVGRNVIDSAWNQIICDGYEAAQTAVECLISHGHQRIGYIGETENEIRYKAYEDTIHNHELDFDTSLIIESQHNGIGGYQGADEMLKNAALLPTAVFCATDVSAIAAMRRFREAGIKIPQQLSIISIDNIELSGYVSPMLTTVEMPIIEMGNMAVDTLINHINKCYRLPTRIYFPNRLIIRESVGEPLTGSSV